MREQESTPNSTEMTYVSKRRAMMNPFLLALAGVLVLLGSGEKAQSNGPLSHLIGHSGWIQLADLRADGVFITAKSFALRSPAKPDQVLPEPGDTIELLSSRELVILGFGEKHDESRASESPA